MKAFKLSRVSIVVVCVWEGERGAVRVIGECKAVEIVYKSCMIEHCVVWLLFHFKQKTKQTKYKHTSKY